MDLKKKERDAEIIARYEARDEEAIALSDREYGGLCRKLAVNILRDYEDARECVSDTWLAAWNRIPPERPAYLSAFFCRITRNISMNRLDYLRAEKRDAARTESYDALAALEELGNGLAGLDHHLEAVSEDELREILNDFLGNLSREMRVVFLRRYWFGDTVLQVAELTGFSESKIKSMLHRARKGLRQRLEEEGVAI